MSLRTRALLVFLSSAVVALTVFLMLAEGVVGRGFEELEQADAAERVDRALNAVTSDLERQLIATRDVALSPATSELLRGSRTALLPSHEDVSSAADRPYDALIVLGPLGEVIHEVGATSSLPDGIARQLMSNTLRLPNPGRSEVGGIASADGHLAAVVSYAVPGHPVPDGTVITVDVLTARDIAATGEAVALDLKLTPYQGREGVAVLPFEVGALDVTEVEADVTATTYLTDPVGRFVVSVGADVPQAIVAAGQNAYRQLVGLIILAAAVVMASGIFWFERAIMSRMARLQALVARSDEPDRPTIVIPGGDEVSHLATRVEDTLRSLEDAQRELQDASELKDDFVSMVSHEFRTPLTSIRGYTETLLLHTDRLTGEQRRVFAEKVLAQSLNLNRMVDDLLTLSQARKGTMHREPADVRVVDLAADAIESVGSPVGVGIDIAPDLLVHADPDHVRRILTNYLENALKYGSVPITIEGRERAGRIEIRVADHGPGVPVAFQEQLFERFTQASVGTQRTAKGVGLGLSIVQTLAEVNGGVVWFEPNHPGAIFGVRLPAPVPQDTVEPREDVRAGQTVG